MPSVVKSFCFPEWSLSFFLPNKDETCCPSPKKETNVLPIPKEVNKLNIKGGNVLSIPPPTSPPQQKEEKHVASGISHRLATYTIASMAVWLF